MHLSLIMIAILSLVQGAAELLPVSSSAHVIIIAKLMGLDPTTPEMTLLLVALHTGTMLAVICYFWKTWKSCFFYSWAAFRHTFILVAISTLMTGIIGLGLKFVIEKIILRASPQAEVEMLFGNLALISAALAAAGVLIIYAGLRVRTSPALASVDTKTAFWIGIVQGFCLPFRGFSRSGATISTGLILGAEKTAAETYSFALAVVLTPPVVLLEIGETPSRCILFRQLPVANCSLSVWSPLQHDRRFNCA